MAIEYLGLNAINGPLVVLEGVSGASYDEIVEMTVGGTEKKLGKIVEIYEGKAIIQVFEGTENMALRNTHTRLTGHPMEIAVSEEMLGRTFNGIGQPLRILSRSETATGFIKKFRNGGNRIGDGNQPGCHRLAPGNPL